MNSQDVLNFYICFVEGQTSCGAGIALIQACSTLINTSPEGFRCFHPRCKGRVANVHIGTLAGPIDLLFDGESLRRRPLDGLYGCGFSSLPTYIDGDVADAILGLVCIIRSHVNPVECNGLCSLVIAKAILDCCCVLIESIDHTIYREVAKGFMNLDGVLSSHSYWERSSCSQQADFCIECRRCTLNLRNNRSLRCGICLCLSINVRYLWLAILQNDFPLSICLVNSGSRCYFLRSCNSHCLPLFFLPKFCIEDNIVVVEILAVGVVSSKVLTEHTAVIHQITLLEILSLCCPGIFCISCRWCIGVVVDALAWNNLHDPVVIDFVARNLLIRVLTCGLEVETYIVSPCERGIDGCTVDHTEVVENMPVVG